MLPRREEERSKGGRGNTEPRGYKGVGFVMTKA